MKIYFLPQTKIGRRTAELAILWPILTIFSSVVVNTIYPGVEAGNGIFDDLGVRPMLAITMLIGIAVGVASFPASIIAIIKKGERSVISILVALLGLFLIILLVGEFFFEH